MNVDELAAKYGLTNEWIEESPCEKVQRANRIAKSRGVKPSEIYRDALAEYLDKYETVASR